MTLQEFNTLSDADKETMLQSFDQQAADSQKALELEQAEKNSFKDELEKLKEDYKDLLEDNRKTKEMNFTLGRKLNVENKKQSAEEILHNMFNKGG